MGYITNGVETIIEWHPDKRAAWAACRDYAGLLKAAGLVPELLVSVRRFTNRPAGWHVILHHHPDPDRPPLDPAAVAARLAGGVRLTTPILVPEWRSG